MSKSKHHTKEAKKPATMTHKEKRTAKQIKKHLHDVTTPIIIPH